jgi:hypothetical protein
LKIVRLKAGSILDGIRLGKSPITPVATTVTIVKHEAIKAFPVDSFAMNILIERSAVTARTGTISR